MDSYSDTFVGQQCQNPTAPTHPHCFQAARQDTNGDDTTWSYPQYPPRPGGTLLVRIIIAYLMGCSGLRTARYRRTSTAFALQA
jgi:hypothetical protein